MVKAVAWRADSTELARSPGSFAPAGRVNLRYLEKGERGTKKEPGAVWRLA